MFALHRPCPDECVHCCTSRRRKTHKTEVRSVYYPWHPWYGRSLVIRELLVKGGLAVYRCCLEVDDSAAKSLEMPQWMFDRAICCGLRPSLDHPPSVTFRTSFLAFFSTSPPPDRPPPVAVAETSFTPLRGRFQAPGMLPTLNSSGSPTPHPPAWWPLGRRPPCSCMRALAGR